ncbi:MAG: ThiF family adenylyltransferase [Phycisphaeraceae bacterium]|nr:ThiF family adenylyltransferase [Phycisphaeraceae bacterium]MCB9846931.1 ThiF family adenylyltransferase [Phycisphaeraceae bacterium]
MTDGTPQPDRHHRQRLLPGIGDAGQRRLREAHALIVGVGALGSAVAESLCRAGVGTLTLVDRDIVEPTNLQRQSLYAEADLGAAKAHAAAKRLRAIDASAQINPVAEDFAQRNARRLAGGADLIIDGTDNFETRYLINDLTVATDRPYIYGGVVATQAMQMTIIPGRTPCLRCVFEDPPPPGSTPTCDSAGVLGPAVQTVAALQAIAAMKILVGAPETVDRRLFTADLWTNRFERIDLGDPKPGCPCCARREFDFLEGEAGAEIRSLCGRNSVQIAPGDDAPISRVDLDDLARRLTPFGAFEVRDRLLRGSFADERTDQGDSAIGLTLFPDGRAIITGTTRSDRARSIYAKYVGA